MRENVLMMKSEEVSIEFIDGDGCLCEVVFCFNFVLDKIITKKEVLLNGEVFLEVISFC